MQLEIIADALQDLLGEVVFVGGCTTVLLVDEAAHFGVRRTKDVDVIVDITTKVDYLNFSSRLKSIGFKEDIDGPVCRWLIDSPLGIMKLDVMPIDETVLGFSNGWYKPAIENSTLVTLKNGKAINVVSPVYFIATKFEAFTGRGNGDFFSHDLEDIVFILENRERILFELMDSPVDLKAYFAEQAQQLLVDDFLNVLPGLLNNPNSLESIINTLKIISRWQENI